MEGTKKSIINQCNKRHFSASGSILLPLALKWRLFGFSTGVALAMLAMPCVATKPASALTSITLEIPDSFSLSVRPDSKLHTQKSETIKIKTDAYAGYTFTIKGSDDSGQLKNGSTGLNSISGPLDTATYGGSDNINTWAYLPSKLNGASNDKYQPGPTTTAALIDKTDEANDSALNEYTITLGAKVDITIPTGQYTGIFVLTATANPVPYRITYELNSGTGGPSANPQIGSGAEGSQIKLAEAPTRGGYTFMGWCSTATTEEKCNGTATPTYEAGTNYTLTNSANELTLYAMWEQDAPPMQNWTECSSLAVNDTVTLKDMRDGNNYLVAKLKDDKCWMVQNLRLGEGKQAGEQIELTSEDSDITSSTEKTFALRITEDTHDVGSDHNAAATYIDHIYGGYYSWHTATAGSGTNEMSTLGENAQDSICPKGWRLPTGGSLKSGAGNGEFFALAQAYGGVSAAASEALQKDPIPGFQLGGYIYSDGQLDYQGESGVYWSSTVQSANRGAYTFYFANDIVTPYWGYGSSFDSSNDYGLSVRCVASE